MKNYNSKIEVDEFLKEKQQTITEERYKELEARKIEHLQAMIKRSKAKINEKLPPTSLTTAQEEYIRKM